MSDQFRFDPQQYLEAMETRLGERIDRVQETVDVAMADAKTDTRRLAAVEDRTQVLSRGALAVVTAILGLLATLVGHIVYGPVPARPTAPNSTIALPAAR